MVTYTLTMPRLGETMEEGRIVQWLIASGQAYKRGEAIVEIETDKTVAEFPALEDGTLIEILRSAGDMVEVGTPIARIASAGIAPAVVKAPAAAPPNLLAHRPTSAVAPGSRLRATPLARRLARQGSLSLEGIVGNGPRGRIEKTDVLAALDPATAKTGKTANPETLTSLTISGGCLAYTLNGPESGAPVLLLHGFSADHSVWAALASALAQTGHRVIAPDLPGHGATTLEAPDVDALGAPLAALIKATAPGRKVELVAHSLGAAAAVALVIQHPGCLSGLTLIAPAGLGLGIDADFVNGMAWATSSGEVLHLVSRIAETAPAPSPAAAQAIAVELARGRLKHLAANTLGASGQRVNLLADLAQIARAMPLRVIFGLADRIIPWQQVTALSPLAELHLLQGAGHMPHWDRPREVQQILVRAFGTETK